MDSKMVFALLFVSLALLLLFPSTNCSTGIGDAAGGGEFSDSLHEVSDCSFSSSVEFQQEQHIAWEMTIHGFNSRTGPKMALTFQDLYGNSTPVVLSAFYGDKKGHMDDIDIVTLVLTYCSSNKMRKLWALIVMDGPSSLSTTSSRLQGAINSTFRGTYRSQDSSSGSAGKKMIDGALVISNTTQFLGVNINDKNYRTFTELYNSFDELVEMVVVEVSLRSIKKWFDTAVGDIEITADHHQPPRFSRKYLESRFTMVVKAKPNELDKFWWFLSPFTLEMWLTLVALSVFTGFVTWIIERRNENGPNLVEALLFFMHRDAPRNRLTNFVQVPWLFLVLVVTSTYTASFSSMVTSSETKPPCLDMENLKLTNAIIGCDGDSIIFRYLVETLGFKRKNIKNMARSSIDDYAKALSSGNIKAAFFSTAHADVFLAKYRKGFSAWEPIRNLPHSTLVFPRGSPFISEPKFKQMKEYMLSFLDCSGSTIDGTMKRGIGPGPFSGLFFLSGGASAIAMLITLIRLIERPWENYIQRMLMGRELWVWLTTLFPRNHRRNELQIQVQG
ncbi:glutamate receptor 2.8-like [Herrania umbratica]|uniref:Glutamate receptor 2.8-like n=1 Tax=Herrania umbratica TaxID=108875 RepID=A0A6J0ZH77_9ROSI|nr:glutamate receptor 2.8-like [Herrania umbratica]XP_021274278.1 glutamate receptor 2.8-like [Herrania umbratica]